MIFARSHDYLTPLGLPHGRGTDRDGHTLARRAPGEPAVPPAPESDAPLSAREPHLHLSLCLRCHDAPRAHSRTRYCPPCLELMENLAFDIGWEGDDA